MTTLVVDDDCMVRAYLVRLLTSAGFTCADAAHAEGALCLLETLVPKIAVLDIDLPGQSGAELAWRMRERLPNLPLVAVTGKLDIWDPDDLADLGFDEIFGKPLDSMAFLAACARLAGSDISQ